MKARSLADCLHGDSPLARIEEHALRLGRVQRTLDLLLPDYLAGSVSVANLQNGVLALHVPGAAVAARLKMLIPRIKEGFWAQGTAVDEIRVRVRPPRAADLAREVAPRPVSGDVLSGLESLRTSLPERSPLAAPLARLIARAARRR